MKIKQIISKRVILYLGLVSIIALNFSFMAFQYHLYQVGNS